MVSPGVDGRYHLPVLLARSAAASSGSKHTCYPLADPVICSADRQRGDRDGAKRKPAASVRPMHENVVRGGFVEAYPFLIGEEVEVHVIELRQVYVCGSCEGAQLRSL
jgi:hypothetical protein